MHKALVHYAVCQPRKTRPHQTPLPMTAELERAAPLQTVCSPCAPLQRATGTSHLVRPVRSWPARGRAGLRPGALRSQNFLRHRSGSEDSRERGHSTTGFLCPDFGQQTFRRLAEIFHPGVAISDPGVKRSRPGVATPHPGGASSRSGGGSSQSGIAPPKPANATPWPNSTIPMMFAPGGNQLETTNCALLARDASSRVRFPACTTAGVGGG